MLEQLRDISPRDLMALGIQGIAYVRPLVADDRTVYAVHAADGSRIAIFDDRDLAIATMRENGLEPVSVH